MIALGIESTAHTLGSRRPILLGEPGAVPPTLGLKGPEDG